tara:strand:+ start:968 stop:1438 length:471 start_codon:yes stop_codon:yes gene_type:complete
MTICLVFDIDDTLYVHKHTIVPYETIRPDYQLKHQLQMISYPKFVLSNATFEHANLIVNRLSIDEQIHKIYSRDNIPRMKPNLVCYQSVQRDICQTIQNQFNQYVFFDDLLENMEGARAAGWRTIWISPRYQEASNYPYVERAFPTVKDALDQLKF